MFYQAIVADFPSFDKVNREDVFYKISPAEATYNERLIRRLKNDLMAQITNFLVFVEQQNDKKTQDLYLLESTMRRGLLDMFEKEVNRVRKGQKMETIHEFDFLFHQFKIEDLSYRYKSIYFNRNTVFDLKAPTKFLDYYYLLHKLRYSILAMQRQQILDIKQEIQMMDEVLSFMKNNQLKEIPLIPMYYHLLLLHHNMEEESSFYVLKTLFNEHLETTSEYELRQVVNFTIGYCRLRYNAGHLKFKEEEFLLYKILIQKQAIYVGRGNVEQYILSHHFRNIVEAGLIMAMQGKESYQWTADFIERYKDKTMPAHRDSLYCFCMAAFHFAQKQFSETQDFLVQIQFEEEMIDLYYTIYFKTLEVKTAYELKEWNVLDSALEAFRQYLRRNKKISPNFKETYNNFLKLTRKLFLRKTGNRDVSTDSIDRLKAEIEGTNPLREQLWLMEKAGELLG